MSEIHISSQELVRAKPPFPSMYSKQHCRMDRGELGGGGGRGDGGWRGGSGGEMGGWGRGSGCEWNWKHKWCQDQIIKGQRQNEGCEHV